MAVSSICTVGELDKIRNQWMRAYTPISGREVKEWESEVRSNMMRVPYLRVVQISSTGLFSLLEVRTAMNFQGMNMEGVKQDLQMVWGKISNGMRASHCIRNTDRGFELSFIALTAESNYITGFISVVRKE